MALLNVEGLSVSFGGIRALDEFNLVVDPGEVLSVIGPNGAGKTTVLNCITRVYNPAQGSIRLDGLELTSLRPHQVIEKGVARTFQHLQLFGSMTVMDNLLVGQHSTAKYGLWDALFHSSHSARQESAATQRADEVLDFLSIAHLSGARIDGLSYPLRKRVELARALVSGPRLLLLDEPAGGLTDEELTNLGGVIRSIPDRFGAAVLLIEHQMKLVMEISNRVCVLDFGKTIAEGTPHEVQNDPGVIQTYLGAKDA